MQRLVLTYGLIGGAVLAAIFAATFPFKDQIGLDNSAYVGYTSMVAAFLMVYFGVKAHRDTTGGPLSFGQALTVGLLISLVITACYVVTWEIAYRFFMPGFMQEYAAHVLEQARAAGATEAELARQSKEMTDFLTMYENPLIRAGITAIEPLPVALVFTLVTAGVLGRKGAPAGPAPQLSQEQSR